jgi:anaerobic magnesium-protoporphyrin IX monomethyl ester cyclase
MKTDVLLISVQQDLDVIGLKYLHYALLQHSYNSAMLFLPNLRDQADSLESVASFIRENSPSVVGISLMSSEYLRARSLTEYLKTHFPSLPVIWGGIHPTIAPEECLQYADYACVGESEQAILDIAREAAMGNTDLKHINNLCYREGGQVTRNPLYPLIDDLDILPLCEHLPQQSYIQSGTKIVPLTQKVFRKHARYAGTTYSIMSSRGCPFACTYCCNDSYNRLYGTKKVRHRSVAHVLGELEKAVRDNPYLQYINFQDDCFLASSRQYLHEFCELYQQKIKKPFIIRSIPIFVDNEKIRILKEAGIGWISLGLQSGSDRICKDVYKRRSLQADFLNAARIIKEYNIAAFYDVILDNPYETEEDQLQTIYPFWRFQNLSIHSSSLSLSTWEHNCLKGLQRSTHTGLRMP